MKCLSRKNRIHPAEQEDEEEETLSDAEPYVDSKAVLIHVHAPWLLATFTGFLSFYYVYTKDVNGITYLPVYVCFNVIYIAKSYLSYIKMMILTMTSFFPTLVATVSIAPQLDGDIMTILMNVFFLCYMGCHMIGGNCWKLRKDELNNRLLTDEVSYELYYNKHVFSDNCFYCLSAANVTAMLLGGCYLFGWILPVHFVPHIERPPAGLLCKSIFTLAVCGFGFLTLKFAKKMFCLFLKIRSLKASEREETRSEVHI